MDKFNTRIPLETIDFDVPDTFEQEGLMNWHEAMLIVKCGGRIRNKFWDNRYRFLTMMHIELPSRCVVRKVMDIRCNPGEIDGISLYVAATYPGVRAWQRVFDLDETDRVKSERPARLTEDEKDRIVDMHERTLKFANATRKEHHNDKT